MTQSMEWLEDRKSKSQNIQIENRERKDTEVLSRRTPKETYQMNCKDRKFRNVWNKKEEALRTSIKYGIASPVKEYNKQEVIGEKGLFYSYFIWTFKCIWSNLLERLDEVSCKQKWRDHE